MSKIISLFLLCLFALVSCGGKSEVKDGEQSRDSVLIDTVTLSEDAVMPLRTDSTLFLLPRNEYKTYSDHYAYMSDEEYFKTDFGEGSHFEDTISAGLFNEENWLSLVDSLKLNQDWLCITFAASETNSPVVVHKGKTTSYSANDIIEFVPLTLLNLKNDNRDIDIAFRGNYEKSDFSMISPQSVSATEQRDVVGSIQKYVKQNNVVPPRPMAADTMLLDNVCKLTDNLVVAEYHTIRSSDSDGDYGNECFFVLIDNKVTHWFAAMHCGYQAFELRDQKYFFVGSSTYATGRTNLFKLKDNKLKEIYKYIFFGD